MSDASATETTLSGELMTAPSGLVGTTLLALSGIALVRAAARLVGRAALAYRRPAEVRLSERGLELSHRTLLLGRVLSQGETLIPLANLSSVTREVQYPRLWAVRRSPRTDRRHVRRDRALVDGFRVPGGSLSLLGLGLAAMALGVVLDFRAQRRHRRGSQDVPPHRDAAPRPTSLCSGARTRSHRSRARAPRGRGGGVPRSVLARLGERRRGVGASPETRTASAVDRRSWRRSTPPGKSEQAIELSRRDSSVSVNDLADGAKRHRLDEAQGLSAEQQGTESADVPLRERVDRGTEERGVARRLVRGLFHGLHVEHRTAVFRRREREHRGDD